MAGGRVKDDAVLYLNNLKACWDHLCFDVPRLVVRLRKLGSAGLLTVWAHKIFSPVLTHRRNMRPESGIFQPVTRACPPQAELWCSRVRRRPNVSLIWHNTQIAETGSDLGSSTIRIADGDITAASPSSQPHKPDGVLDHLKAKPLRGGPAGRP